MIATVDRPPTQYALAELVPNRVERVTTAEEAAACLKRASQEDEAVVPWGAGTKQSQGNFPARYDVALDVSALDSIIEYEPADLVVTAGAGITLAALQRRLAESGQFLPLDPPYAQTATLGGTLATNASGPSRLLYGSARDMVLGLRVATPQGELVKSGGRVVKNVVGYDLNKLHIGALGTAGVMVEVTLKVQPLPAAEATVVATFGDLAGACLVASRVAHSILYPRAVDIARNVSGAPEWRVLVWAGGSPATVERQVRDATGWCNEGGAKSVEQLDGDAHRSLWRSIVEFGRASKGGALLKVTCLPNKLGALLMPASDAGSMDAITGVVARAGNGVAYLYSESANVGAILSASAVATALGGSAVLEEAPLNLKDGLDVWDPAGGAAGRRDDLPLMRAVKAQFDPEGTLNPGRYVGGI